MPASPLASLYTPTPPATRLHALFIAFLPSLLPGSQGLTWQLPWGIAVFIYPGLWAALGGGCDVAAWETLATRPSLVCFPQAAVSRSSPSPSESPGGFAPMPTWGHRAFTPAGTHAAVAAAPCPLPGMQLSFPLPYHPSPSLDKESLAQVWCKTQRKLEFQAWAVCSMEGLRLIFKFVQLSGCHLGEVYSMTPYEQGP